MIRDTKFSYAAIFVILSLLLVPALGDEKTEESLREEKEGLARELAQEVLTGRKVCVRVYNNWKKAPRVYKLVAVELDGLSFQCDSVAEAFGPMSESAAIVVAGQDQTDEAVAAVLDNIVFTEYYSDTKGRSISILPGRYRGKEYTWWIFQDAARDPVPNVEVDIFIGSDEYSGDRPRIWLKKAKLDEKGRLKPLKLVSALREFSFLVHHPDCGLVRTRNYSGFLSDESCRTYMALALPKDKWCVFTDALGEPIPNATVEITYDINWEDKRPESFAKVKLDEKGRLQPPQLDVRLTMSYFILSHPDYGIALIEPATRGGSGRFLETCMAPLIRAGSKFDDRTIWGAVVDPNNNPVAKALIECNSVMLQSGGTINSRYGKKYRAITDTEGCFAMYLPIDKDSDRHGSLVPIASMYRVEIKAPKALGLVNYSGGINSGEETIITMFPEGNDGYFHTFAFEDEFGPIADPEQLRLIVITIRQEKGMRSFLYDRWKDGGKFPTGTYTVRFWGEKLLRFKPIQVTEDSPELLVFKAKAKDSIFYKGRVIHGLTGEPIPGAIVMKLPSGSDRIPANANDEQTWAMLSVGPELYPSDLIFEFLKEDFKSTMMTRTDINGDFQIALPKREDGNPEELIAVKKDYLGAHQQLKYVVPTNKLGSGPEPFREFEPDGDGYVKFHPMKLFPAGTVIVEPNLPGNLSVRNGQIRFYWRIAPENTTPWLKDFRTITREPRGSSVFYKNRLRPNHIQSVYIAAGVEQTLKIFPRRETQWAPVVIPGVKLRQGEILDLGRLDFKTNYKVAVKVVDSSSKPVEGVEVRGLDENGLYMGHKSITNENGIVMLYVPPYSKGMFTVSYYDKSTKKTIQDGISYETAGQEDAGRQFTLQISDEMLYELFK